MPKYFPYAGLSWAADAASAGDLLAALYKRFGDWQLAIAAYNWGQGNVHHEMASDGVPQLADMPTETQRYVTQIVGDVPVPGILL
jgi:membrane-bound lytic murein transglycosylase D